MYDEPFRNQQVWDAMCNVFFPENAKDPLFFEKSYHALCVPKSYLKRMSDILYDFYWIVKDNLLTSQMYIRKQVSYQKDNNEETPESYLAHLYTRGFPRVGGE